MLGTGDLSELALGWCTYGVGDQMSHYNVNAGVPKTLIQHLIRWVVSSRQLDGAADATLLSILDTEISPELVPVEAGSKPQSTEERVGPYELQDFNLFYTLRYGFKPSKIAFLSLMAWGDVADGHWPEGFPEDRRRAYDLAHIRRWLHVFVHRFFGFSQFKRSALPNGPKVVGGRVPCRRAATGGHPPTAMRALGSTNWSGTCPRPEAAPANPHRACPFQLSNRRGDADR